MSRLRLESIGSKILVRTILVVLVPLLILSGIVFLGLGQLRSTAAEQVDLSRDQLSRESVAVNAEDQAVSIAREINATLLERVEDVTAWARNPIVIEGAISGNDLAEQARLVGRPIDELESLFEGLRSTGVASEAQGYLIREIALAPEFGEVFFTDRNGFNAALTNRTSDFVQNDEAWWQDAWANGISVSDVEFDESSSIYSVDVSVRIDNPTTGERLGVMKASLSIAFVQSITTARSGGSIDYTVALPDGRLIAETQSSHDPIRLLAELPADELPAGLGTAMTSDESGAVVTDDVVVGYTRTSTSNFLDNEVRGFRGFDWIVVSSQEADAAFSPLRGLENLNNEIDSSQAGLQGTVITAVLIAIAVAAAMSRLLARSLVEPILRLASAASDAATTNLPEAVERIDRAGGDLDSVEVPKIELNTGDELDRLAESFNSVQGTALRLASEQALSRRNTADMFINLGRRNNSLLKRQLRFIDGLERNEADPETLESLFKLDHLATRMRRNAESLLVLAGERSPRRWSAPVAVLDTVQSALAEVEDYERANIGQIGPGMLQGNVVADVAHVLAELLENAITFSPPQTTVMLYGRERESGYTITITDEGIGMADDELDAANERLSSAFELSQVPARHIGLFVVGRLAQQHDISVRLSRSPSGGTTATIDLPREITAAGSAESDDDDGDADVEAKPGAEATSAAEPTTADAPAATETDDDGRDLGRRSNDSPASTEADARRGPDDPPAEVVAIGGLEVRRRGSTDGAAAASKPSGGDVSTPDQSDTAEDDEPDLDQYGFRRRGRDDGPSEAKPPASVAIKTEPDTPPEEVEATAALNRSQWSSFQRAKQTAESEPTSGESAESVTPGQGPSDREGA